MRVLLVNGPNLNRLGRRDPAVYGSQTLTDVVAELRALAEREGATLDAVQSNHEGVLLDWLHERQDDADAVIVNPAGLTAVGDPLRDALADAALPLAVVHISNPQARPAPWRREDIFAPLADVYVAGAGTRGYTYALLALGAHVRAGTDPRSKGR